LSIPKVALESTHFPCHLSPLYSGATQVLLRGCLTRVYPGDAQVLLRRALENGLVEAGYALQISSPLKINIRIKLFPKSFDRNRFWPPGSKNRHHKNYSIAPGFFSNTFLKTNF
jgi:hypothetical protein